MAKHSTDTAALLAGNDHNEILAHVLERLDALEARLPAEPEPEAPKTEKTGKK